MREIKFKCWDKKNKQWLTPWPFNLFGEFMIIQGLPLKRLDDLEVVQYTGLKDKNGKEIFEGDIVTFRRNGKVIYDAPNWIIKSKDRQGIEFTHPLSVVPIEIIGNIYENPELLEKRDD